MTKYQRALQIWSMLVCAARDRRTYTYGELASALGMGGAGVMGRFLGPIMYYPALPSVASQRYMSKVSGLLRVLSLRLRST